MKSSILFGIVLAVVIVAVIVVVPRFVPAISPQAVSAIDQAERARRELQRYDYGIERLASRIDAPTLGGVDLAPIVEKSRAAFDEMAQKFGQDVGRIRQQDRKRGLSESKIQAPSADAGSIRTAVGGFGRMSNENQALLNEAARNAQQAAQAGKDVRGVPQVAGMAAQLRARQLLDEARRLRQELERMRETIAGDLTQLALLEAEASHYEARRVDEIVTQLRADLEEIGTQQQEAQQQADAISAQVSEREQALAQVAEQLKQGRKQLMDMQDLGFSAGNDAAFEGYRQQYQALSEQLRKLEEREQLLAVGGLEGAEFANDDLLSGEMSGGTEQPGLGELKYRHAIAHERAERLTASRKTIEDRIAAAELIGKESGASRANFAQRAAQLKSRLSGMKESIEQTFNAAIEKEDEAIRAARDAARSFADARSAADAQIRQARDLKSAFDSQGINERLKLITSDVYGPAIGAGGEADAQAMIGRILFERLDSLGRWGETLQRLSAKVPEIAFDPKAHAERVAASVDEALQALSNARNSYEQLTRSLGNANWVPQAALATVDYMLSKIDARGAAKHLASAKDNIRQVVTRRERSPYVQAYVRFRDHIGAGGAAPAPAPEDEPEASEPEAPSDEATPPPAEPPPAEGSEDTGGGGG